MNPELEAQSSDVDLMLHWLNSHAGIKELLISVKNVNTLDSYLEEIFDKTAEFEQNFNPEFISTPFDKSKRQIELLRNATRLDDAEYHIPISYFEKNEAENIEMFLNTRHCGSLIIEASSATPSSDPGGLLLEFDYGTHTTQDLLTKIQDKVQETVDFVFTESHLLAYPGKAGEFLRDHLEQCDNVMFRAMSNRSEVGLIVKIQLERDAWNQPYKSHVLFIDKDIRVKELEQKVEEETGVSIHGLMNLYKGVTLKKEDLLRSHHELKDGDEIYFLRPQYTTRDFMKRMCLFTDLTEEPENIPIEEVKWKKPSNGLNFVGLCTNPKCKLCQRGIASMSAWKKSTFDLLTDIQSVVCRRCSNPLRIQTPAFHLTQWKFFGEKSEAGGEFEGKGQSSTTGDENHEKSENAETFLIEHKNGLLTCDWQTAEDSNGYTAFTVVDTPSLRVGLSDWKKLVIMTRPLPKQDKKASLNQEKYNFGIDVSVPLMFTVSFKFDWFRDFFK